MLPWLESLVGANVPIATLIKAEIGEPSFINDFHLTSQCSPSKIIAFRTNTLLTHLLVYLGSPPSEPTHPTRINEGEKYNNDSECEA